ncbi:MAG: ATP-binding protein [Pseudomonadales bacterium]
MKIQTKLILSILLASLVLVTVLYFLLQWSVDRGVLNYVNQRQMEQFEPVVQGLEAHYAEHQQWQAFAQSPRAFHDLVRRFDSQALGRRGFDARPPHRGPKGRGPEKGASVQREPKPPGPRGARPPGRGPGAGGPENIGLLDGDKQMIVRGPGESGLLLPLQYQGETVAWLALRAGDRLTTDYELSFLEQLQETLLFICLVVFALALLIAYPLARHLTKPLATLEQSTARLASGDFSQRIDFQRADEFGSLQRSFNELASTLEEGDRSRKRWLADISHELRTPLSIMRAQLGAMLDGIRPLSKQELEVAMTQIAHLQKLMDDLHELSNADIGALRYSKKTIDLSELLSEAIEPHKLAFKERGISLSVYPPSQKILVHIDPSRIHQLLDNLLSNSLKYTAGGGKTKCSWQLDRVASPAYSEVLICIEDSKPGVEEEELERLFDHLYRAENSRNRATGGSGLGLSICKRIVEAHHGSIKANASQFGGLRIEIRLPVAA